MDSKNSKHVSFDQTVNKKDILKDAPVEEAITLKGDLFVKKDKYSKLRRTSVKSANCTKLNKKEFIKRFVKDTSTLVWPREMKIVNSLLKIFPNEDFWNSLSLGFKLNSLCWFLSDDGRKLLNTEYKKFKFEPEKPKSFDLINNNIAFPEKKSDDKTAPLTVREFLNLWQKKK